MQKTEERMTTGNTGTIINNQQYVPLKKKIPYLKYHIQFDLGKI